MARLRRLKREDLGTLDQPVARGLSDTIEAYLLAGDAAGRSPHTLTSYRWHLGQLLDALGDMLLSEVTSEAINRHLVQCREAGFKPHSLASRHRTLTAFLNWCVKDGRLERTPMAAVQAPKLPQVEPPGFTVAEVGAMLAACNQRTPVGARDYALLLTLYGTALRISECMALTRADVVRSGLSQYVRVIGKGRKERLIPLLPEVREALAVYLRLRGEDAEPALWLGERGPLTVGGAFQAVKKRGLLAGIPDAHPHRFRRAALAAMARSEIDVLSLAQLAGHSNLQQLRHYVAHREQERAVDALLKNDYLRELSLDGKGKAKK